MNEQRKDAALHGFEFDDPQDTPGQPAVGKDPTQGPGSPAWQQAIRMGLKKNAMRRRN